MTMRFMILFLAAIFLLPMASDTSYAAAAAKKTKKTAVKKGKKGKKTKKAPAAAPAAGATDAAAAEAAADPAATGEMGYQPVPWGMAGCGWGSMVQKENTMFSQILAVTTNTTSASQLFGISSGTANCVDPKKQQVAEQEVFIQMNLASLTEEAAQGDGESLQAFAELLGCDQTMFKGIAQQEHQTLYGSRSASEVLRRHQTRFKGVCERVG
jgi:hypothetical protein